MAAEDVILVGKGQTPQELHLGLANRHGLIAGATGTGKTVTLQVLAEGFSAAGVPVFLADVKGDLSGICARRATPAPKLAERAAQLGLDDYAPRACPVVFWDVFGEQGHPVRTTVSEMGPLLLARLLELNDTQEGVLNVAFTRRRRPGPAAARPQGPAGACCSSSARTPRSCRRPYGNVARPAVGAIQRGLLVLEQQGGERFFGEPALDLDDLMRTDADGPGHRQHPRRRPADAAPRALRDLPALAALGAVRGAARGRRSADKPKLVFFFDEAHLLFDDAPKALLDKVEQVVRLIRSKGVGVYFVTQNPLDVPDDVAGASSATGCSTRCAPSPPRDQKAVKAAAETFRAEPGLRRRATRSPSWRSARRWSRCSRTRACPASSSGR